MLSLIVPCVYEDVERASVMLERLSKTKYDLPNETILVISGSAFEEHEKLESLKKVLPVFKIFWRPEIAFAGDNRNYGAERAKGNIIAFHDADDEMHPAKISIVKHIFRENKNVDVMVHLLQPYGYEWQTYGDFEKITLVSRDQVKRNGFQPSRWGRFGGMHCGQVSIRSQLFKKVQFDSSMRIGQDRYFLQQCLASGAFCTIAKAFLVKYDALPNLYRVAARMAEWKKIDEPNGIGKKRSKAKWKQVLTKSEKIARHFEKIPFVFWINLDRCVERRKRMETKFRYIKMEGRHERFVAVDGRTADLECELEFVPEKGRKPMTRNEVSCTLSHLKLIKHVFDQNQHLNEFVVFEDDVVFEHVHLWPKPFEDFLSTVPSDWKVLVLSCGTDKDHIRSELETLRKLGVDWIPHKRHHYGTFAMMINRKGMEELLDRHFSDGKHKFNLEGSRYGKDYVADAVITGLQKGVYTCTTPLVTYEGIDSDIHPENLRNHKKHLEWMISTMK